MTAGDFKLKLRGQIHARCLLGPMKLINVLFISIAFTFIGILISAGLLFLSTLHLSRFFESKSRNRPHLSVPRRGRPSFLSPARSFLQNSLTSLKRLLPSSEKNPEPRVEPKPESVSVAHEAPPAISESPEPLAFTQPSLPASFRPDREETTAVAVKKIQRVTLGTGPYLRSLAKKQKSAPAPQAGPDKDPAPLAAETPASRTSYDPLAVKHGSLLLAGQPHLLSQPYFYSRCVTSSLGRFRSPN